MPIFGKFNAKKTPARKNTEVNKDIDEDYNFLEEDNIVRLCLGDSETIFEDGQWIPDSGNDGQSHKMYKKLQKQIQKLKEENNLLKIKFEILLDMNQQQIIKILRADSSIRN